MGKCDEFNGSGRSYGDVGLGCDGGPEVGYAIIAWKGFGDLQGQ